MATATCWKWTHDARDHDTVVCLADVTMDRPADGLIDRLRRAFDAVCGVNLLPGEPDLLFTLVPLDDVPAGCVNVLGHVHLHELTVDVDWSPPLIVSLVANRI